MTDAHTPEPGEYDLEMPFLTVTSNGGPHDDTAYTAGYEAGRIDGLLSAAHAATHLGATTQTYTCIVTTTNIPQLDLIAMRHGFTLTTTPSDDGWATARFETTP